MKYNEISNRAKNYIITVIFVIYILINIILFISNIVITSYFASKYSYIIYFLVILNTLVGIFSIIFIPKQIEKNYGYYTDLTRLEARYGIFFVNKKIVLLKNVYKILISKKIIGRIFGISSLTLSTSAGDIKVSLLNERELEKLYNKISNVLNSEEL